ncbi:MAG: Rrf2 family transcriptional regulator [Bacteroidales bacterium]|nr:Rrf2 family transcriptional regulator [Bacteroidales bacterium]
MLSNACKYAIRAFIYLASRQSGLSRVNIKDIAKQVDSPLAFTAKIMQTLSRQGLVSSIKGPNGGFYLTDDQRHVALVDIVKAIDGVHVLNDCGLGLAQCSGEYPCPIHYEYSKIRAGFQTLLEEKTIFQLAEDLQNGDIVVKNMLAL